MYIQSSYRYFIRSTFWKATTAKDPIYTMISGIPMKEEKSQENLCTQVRIGNNDFEVYGKYIKTGGQEKFELLPKSSYDPNDDLPQNN